MLAFIGFLIAPTFLRCRNKPFKKRMWLVRFAVELGMELAADEKRMFRQFDDFHQLPVRRKSAEDETRLLELFAIHVIKFVTMPMLFIHDKGPV